MNRLFGLDEVCPHDENLELLTTVYDNVSLSVLRSILDGENVPYLIRERGSGSVVKIVTGISMYGTDVFVRKDMVERAKEILDAMTDENAEFVDDDELPDVEDKIRNE